MRYAAIASLLAAPLLSAQPDTCAPSGPAPCNEEACCRTYCLGPTNTGINAPVNPRTCNGDWVITLAGLYWNFHQDSMEFGIDDGVTRNDWFDNDGGLLIDSHYILPNSSWNWGFKLGLGYNTTCDGWDLGVLWTRYHGSTSRLVQIEESDNRTLLNLWSWGDDTGPDITFAVAGSISSHWSVDLDLVDATLSRHFWVGRRFSMRPAVGLRYARLKQDHSLLSRGGEYNDEFSEPVNNTVDLSCDFHGVGAIGSLSGTWALGCGFGIYGELALSAIYGRFDVSHTEENRLITAPFSKNNVLELDRSFRAVRAIVDAQIGINYAALLSDCRYGLDVFLGWEVHWLEGQNAWIRVLHEREDDIAINHTPGNFDTQGWTLRVKLEF